VNGRMDGSGRMGGLDGRMDWLRDEQTDSGSMVRICQQLLPCG